LRRISATRNQITSFLRNKVLKKFGTKGGTCGKSVRPDSVSSSRQTYLTIVIRQSEEHEIREDDRHDGERPNSVNDVDGSDVLVRVSSGHSRTPVPESGDYERNSSDNWREDYHRRLTPDLLETLNNTSSQNPYFRGRSSFFTEVATEEQETGCRSDGVD
jgi:hypothetical protein